MVHEVRKWFLETSWKRGEEFIGATVTLLALLTATATLAGHRAHTDEVKSQTKATDQWGFYQAKHIRAHMYGMEAEKALASSDVGMHALVKKYLTAAVYEQCGVPAAKSCNLENCRTITEKCDKLDSTKLCTVPVLKDSPELQAFYKTKLVPDQAFVTRFHPALDPTSVCKKEDAPGGQAAGTAPKEPVSTGEPSSNKPPGAAEIIEQAKTHDHEVENFTRQALLYDIAEVVLEVSIMICSVALVVGTEVHRKSAYLITIVAVVVASAGVGVSLLALRYPVERGVPGGTIGAAALAVLSLIVWVWLYSQEADKPRLENTSTEPLA